MIIHNNNSTHKHECAGVVLDDGRQVFGKSVVITTGTFLRAVINFGNETRQAGRMGDQASVALAQTLDKLDFRLSRLKTGTPPRLKKNTIDLSRCTKQYPDDPIEPFSFMSKKVAINVRTVLFVSGLNSLHFYNVSIFCEARRAAGLLHHSHSFIGSVSLDRHRKSS